MTNRSLTRLPLCLLLVATEALRPGAQTVPPPPAGRVPISTPVARDIDPSIARVIDATAAFDDHAHPMLSPPADAKDRNFDALPVDNMEPQSDPPAVRPDFPPLHDAWLALYGIDLHPPLDAAGSKTLQAARAKAKEHEGQGYSAWVLNRAGIGTMVANRIEMGTGVQPPRFQWVPYDDALLLPLDTSTLARETPDRALFFPLEDKVRARYLERVGSTLPATLDDYVRFVILPTLEYQKEHGAIAVKFELAYLRALDIGKPTHDEAAAVYARGGTPDAATYKPLQDYLFRVIALECGRRHMAVHFHGMAGDGSYFATAGVNPLNMEPLLNDPAMRKTNFVMLHGGWPFVREADAMTLKPNLYLDISQQTLLFPARTLAGWLREWLEFNPEKVLFATDAYPYTPALGWEESAWIASRNGREALGLALTGMLRDGEITQTRAAELAAMVLHGNAEALYGLKVAAVK